MCGVGNLTRAAYATVRKVASSETANFQIALSFDIGEIKAKLTSTNGINALVEFFVFSRTWLSVSETAEYTT